LAARDPANTQWQSDLAVSCSKLGVLQYGQNAELRLGYLRRRKDILLRLKSAGRLVTSQEAWLQWFDDEVAKLTERRP
jgi:uncharacterized protein YecT (DUF1311 family)